MGVTRRYGEGRLGRRGSVISGVFDKYRRAGDSTTGDECPVRRAQRSSFCALDGRTVDWTLVTRQLMV